MFTKVQLLTMIDGYKINHVEINPRTITDVVGTNRFSFSTIDGISNEFVFTKEGFGCLQWFHRGYENDDNKELIAKLTYKAFTGAIKRLEKATTKSEKESAKRNIIRLWNTVITMTFDIKETLYLHCNDTHRIQGMTRQWNDIIDTKDVVEAIFDSGHISKVTNIYLNDTSVLIDIKDKFADGFFVRITNGYSGHEALKYNAVVMLNSEFVYETPLTGKARHLSNLGTVFNKIGDVLNEIRSKNVETKIRDIEVKDVYNDMKKMILLRAADNYEKGDWRNKLKVATDAQIERLDDMMAASVSLFSSSLDGFNFLELLSNLICTRGWKGIGTVLINSYLQKVFEDMK